MIASCKSEQARLRYYSGFFCALTNFLRPPEIILQRLLFYDKIRMGVQQMEFDAFTGGMEPGGLRSKDEIRILICYLLASVNAELSKEDIITIVRDNGLANYFEIADAIAEMAEKGLVILSGPDQLFCTVSDDGRLIAKQLDSALPPAVRGKAVCAAINLLAKAKREQENKVEIQKIPNGYTVTCHISGGDSDLMSFSLLVPDLRQARMVRENFHRSPEKVYRMLLALVTGSNELAADLLR
jgi:hypothetical protein